MGAIEQRLRDLGFALPALNQSAANYVPGVLCGDVVFISDQTPKRDGKLVYKGKLGADVSKEKGYQAAQLCALNCLAALEELVVLDNVERIVRMTGYLNSESDFLDQSQFINGASDLLGNLFGEQGKHARSAWA